MRHLACAIGIAFSLVAGVSVAGTVSAQSFGHFSGSPVVQLMPDGRTIELKSAFSFVDSKRQRWPVPAGYKANGASIPQAFWSVIGGPLDGAYRDASIIHDYYCENFKTLWPEGYKRDWREVHRSFYDGMRARGVHVVKAKIMYWAVWHAGPNWEVKGDRVRLRVRRAASPTEAKAMREAVERFVSTKEPTLEELERFKIRMPGSVVGSAWVKMEPPSR